MAERLMAADCKSAALTCYGGSNPSLPTIFRGAKDGGQLPAISFSGSAISLGNPRPGSPCPSRESSLRNPSAPSHAEELIVRAHVAQLVEHVLGKDGVTSSTLVVGLGISPSRIPGRQEVHHGKSEV